MFLSFLMIKISLIIANEKIYKRIGNFVDFSDECLQSLKSPNEIRYYGCSNKNGWELMDYFLMKRDRLGHNFDVTASELLRDEPVTMEYDFEKFEGFLYGQEMDIFNVKCVYLAIWIADVKKIMLFTKNTIAYNEIAK